MNAVAQRTALDAARDVAAAVGDVEAAYVIGSAASGAFAPGASDLDMVVVLSGEPSRRELLELAGRAGAVDVAPARGLELVVYAGGELVLNLNTGPGVADRVDYGPPAGEEFWFVLDRAIAERYALPLVGPPWRDVFLPVTRAEILDALAASLRWQDQHHPHSAQSALSAIRAWRWLETGEWVSKPEAVAWLIARVRRAVEAVR